MDAVNAFALALIAGVGGWCVAPRMQAEVRAACHPTLSRPSAAVAAAVDSRRGGVVIATVFALLTAWFLSGARGPLLADLLVLAVLLSFVSAGIVLSVVDLTCHRLPDRIVLPLYPLWGALLAAAALIGGDVGGFVRSGSAMVVLFSFYLTLRVATRAGLGGGDVKLAGALGIVLGWSGWGAVVVATSSAFVLGGLWALASVVLRRAGRRTAIAFGPWMILGAGIGLAWGGFR